MSQGSSKILILACGALAREILFLKKGLGSAGEQIDLQCLPADYHNTPSKIIPALEKVLTARRAEYDRVLIGYGDCGTGGELDRFVKAQNLERLPGAHCYAFFAGLAEFDTLMEEEIGSFFLTDYLVKFFDRLIIKGLGLDRYPNLMEVYFGHYQRLVYLAQTEDADLEAQARVAADKLGLAYEYRFTGYGELADAVRGLSQARETAHV